MKLFYEYPPGGETERRRRRRRRRRLTRATCEGSALGARARTRTQLGAKNTRERRLEGKLRLRGSF